MKRLVLSFDGTWNTPEDDGDGGATNTNVRRLHQAVLARDAAGTEQKTWYDPGVGAEWYNRLSGRIAGVGLSRNIRQGYHYLAEHYGEGDQIFLFGFSRGAYTARSLVGLIRNCGILDRMVSWVREAYQIYRIRDEGADGEQASAFRREFARPNNPDITCLGVWDTVGALGIPVQSSTSSTAAFTRSTTPSSAASSRTLSRHWRSTSIAASTRRPCGAPANDRTSASSRPGFRALTPVLAEAIRMISSPT